MFTVAILAGGLATRLRPITETIPKALVEVAGQPFINYQLSYLRDQGVRNVVLCVGYLGDMIKDVVGSGNQFGLMISYATDGATLLGTGGALRKALPLLGDNFFILYGDSFLPINFLQVQKAFEQSNKQALMTILKNGDRWDKSNVHFTDGRLVEYNKKYPTQAMTHIDYGLAVMSADVLVPFVADKAFDLADIYQSLSINGGLVGLEVNERFYEIGSHDGLKEAENYFLTRRMHELCKTTPK